MKIRLSCIALIIFGNFIAATAQKAKPSPKAPTKPSSSVSASEKDKANKMIEYTNRLQDFLAHYISISTISLPLDNYEESLQSEAVYLNPNTLEENFKTVGEAITSFKNDKGSNPTEPPAIIGADNQSFIKSKIVECSNLYENIKSLNNKLKPYTNTEVIKKTDLPAVRAIVKQMFEIQDKIYIVQGDLYDKIDEIGMQAESITLSNHPMKTEILDMKIVINKSKKALVLLAQKTPADAKEKIMQIKSIATQVRLISDKYGDNYSAEGAGKNNSIELRSSVKRFYEQVANYYWHFDELITELQKNGMDAEDWNTRVKMQNDSYESLISEYNSFVMANNGE